MITHVDHDSEYEIKNTHLEYIIYLRVFLRFCLPNDLNEYNLINMLVFDVTSMFVLFLIIIMSRFEYESLNILY